MSFLTLFTGGKKMLGKSPELIVILKKVLKIGLLGHYLSKNWASIGHAQNLVLFFLEITKGDHKLTRNFYFMTSFD